MRKMFILTIIAVIFVFSVQAHADLFNRGEDIFGNRLIYDDDLDITWYDYTKSMDTWQNQMDWADALSIGFGDNVYSDWRLPTAVDGIDVSHSDDGVSSFAGHNITTSEMGHLYYTELENDGWHDTSGADSGCSGSAPWCLVNTSYFEDLQALAYWTGTTYVDDDDTSKAWFHGLGDGGQAIVPKDNSGIYALAVRSGDVVIVPEPISLTLFLIGGITLGLRRFHKKQRSV